MALLLVLLPGTACVLWTMPRDAGRAARMGTALALSPPLGGALIAILMLGGLTAGWAAAALLAASALMTVAGVLRGRRPSGDELPAEPRAIWWIALLFVVGTGLFPAFSEWWRIYSDAWAHAGIVRAIEAGGVPPLDPGFAGVRLQYAWIYHAFVAGVHALTHVDVFALMAVLGASALGSVILCAGSILARARASAVAWGLLFLLLGLNSLFPLFLPIQIGRAFTGEVRGFAELSRQFSLLPLEWDRTGIFLRSLGGQSFFLDKFMVATPFALALGAMIAWLGSFQRFLAGGRFAELMLGALLTAAAGLMHPVVGVFLGAATAMALGLLWIARRGARAFHARFLAWATSVLVGSVPAALLTLTVLGGKGGTHHELPVDLAPLKLLGYVSCLGLGLCFAARPLRRLLRGSEAEFAWAAWVLAGCAFALVIRLPGPSPFFTVDKFSYLVWIPLAITAGPAFAAFVQSRSLLARVALVGVLFLPVNGLAIASRIGDPHNGVRQPWDLEAYAWIRSHTPVDAILVTPPGDWESSEITGRDQYFSLGHAAVQLGYDLAEIQARSELTGRLFETGSLTPEDRARLGALHRPVYVVWTDFSDSLWQYTPGAWARRGLPLTPKPRFASTLPVVFRARGQEVLVVPVGTRQ